MQKPRTIHVGSDHGRYDFEIDQFGYVKVVFNGAARESTIAEVALVLEVENLRKQLQTA